MSAASLTMTLLVFFGFSMFLSNKAHQRWKTNSVGEFLLASRDVIWPVVGLSVAASWVWAPALFVSAQKAYTQGWPGLFWFTVPNILCLVLIIPFMKQARKELPDGTTISDFMGKKYKSTRVGKLFAFETLSVNGAAIAIQLLAAASLLAMITDIPFATLSFLILAGTFVYVLLGGFRATVYTDVMQQLIIVGGSVFLAISILMSDGIQAVDWASAWFGEGGKYRTPFDLDLMLSFGIPVTIGLISGPFGDQMYWQRMWAVKDEKITQTFIFAAIVFAFVPLSMSVFGFLARGIGYEATSAQLVNAELVTQMLPTWGIVLFFYIILSGLCSTMDSAMSAATSTILTDFANDGATTNRARLVLGVVSLLCYLISIIPGIQILWLWLVYSSARSATIFPIAMTLKSKFQYKETYLFWSMLLAMVYGTSTMILIRLSPFEIDNRWTSASILGVLAITYFGMRAGRRLEYAKP